MSEATVTVLFIAGIVAYIAIVHLRVKNRLASEFVDQELAAAKGAREKGDYDLAIAHCNDVIRRYPDQANAHRTRGAMYFLAGEHGHALRDLTKAIELRPDAPS